MSRFNLPELNLLQKEPDIIENEMLASIAEEINIELSNTDPRRAWIKACSIYIGLERNRLEHAFKQNLLSYAEDDILDHQGANSNTPRLKATAAKTTMEFDLETERVVPLLIEYGTLFLVGTETYFETQIDFIVPVGTHVLQLEALCTEVGEIGNGYLPGEISTLVRPLPYVKSVKNITTSSGGADVEDDDIYAERIRLADDKYSTAGPEDAYIYWAKTASQNIAYVAGDSPYPNEVDIRILMKDGELPTVEDIATVLDVLTKKNVKPLTDKVTVAAPTTVSYDAIATYWISKDKSTLVTVIQSAIETAYNEYLIWQRSALGRDVDLSELIMRLKNAGASRVSVSSAMFIEVGKLSVALESGISALTYGGLADA